jgi:hypothetical protein
MMILDETDGPTGRLLELASELDIGDEFDPRQKADEVSLPKSYTELDFSDLNTVQRRKLAAAREMALRMGIDKEVYWGKSPVTDGWRTHGRLVLTDGAAPERARAAWLPALFHALAALAAHRGSTKGGEDTESLSYRSRHSEIVMAHHGVVSDMAAEAERGGLKSAVREDFHYML